MARLKIQVKTSKHAKGLKMWK